MGYQSTLVAARVAEGKLEEAAGVINGHPGVSHNYRRNHAFNMWYTLAVPPDSGLGLEKTVEILHRESGAESTRMLPTLRLFKIGVRFDMTGEGDEEKNIEFKREKVAAAPPGPLTEGEKGMVRVLQRDLPVVAEPFGEWAGGGVGVEELLGAARGFLERGLMRRFAAVLRHREAGIAANAMGVWAVAAERTEEFGAAAAGFAAVSHCYQRPAWPDWPYTMFTMVHGETPEKCAGVLAAIAEKTGVKEYAALYSTKEYKKVRVRYFTPEVGEWERGHGGGQ